MRNVSFFMHDLGEEKEMQLMTFLPRKVLRFFSLELVLLTLPMEGFQHDKGSILVAQTALLMLQKAPTLGCPAESSCKVSSLVP